MPVITNFSDLDLTKQYTYSDYLLWQFSERVELFKGYIHKMSPAPARTHQKVSRKLTRYIDRYFENKTCEFFVAPFDVRLVNYKASKIDNQIHTVVQPDLCIICDEKKLDEKGCIGAPDLVIEILSPGNSKKEMGVKFDLYQENGVKEYWIVEPSEKTIFIYKLQHGIYIGLKPCIEGGKITSPLFPDLDFDIEKIFEI
jgi:Uma2 family endonuclease